jgi:hypothetical protein
VTLPLDRVTDAELALHEALRRSHCDHRNNNDPKHKCVGITVIAPNEVRLSCVLCGNGLVTDRAIEAQRVGIMGKIAIQDTKRHLNVLSRTVSKALFNLMDKAEDLFDPEDP